jgi:hypothetical protein
MDRFGRSLESSSEEKSLLSRSSRLWALKCASHCSRTTARQLNLARKGVTSPFEAVCPCKASLCHSSFHSGRWYALILRFFLYFRPDVFLGLLTGPSPSNRVDGSWDRPRNFVEIGSRTFFSVYSHLPRASEIKPSSYTGSEAIRSIVDRSLQVRIFLIFSVATMWQWSERKTMRPTVLLFTFKIILCQMT